MLDYETLRIIWWLLLGVVLAGFAVTDGFDLGAVAFVRTLGRNDEERRALIETFEPFWEGNQVWLVLGGGATFAAWPLLYAASFSGFYFAMLAILLALIGRPVGLSVRNKMDDPRWRATWDGLLIFSGVVPSLLFGVALGNLFLGVPLRFDVTLRMTYEGGLVGLLRPFALLCGLVSLAMILMHGLAWLQMKAHDELAARAARWLTPFAVGYAALYGLAGLWLATGLPGYRLDSPAAIDVPSNPLGKTVSIGGTWFTNGPLGTWAIVLGVVAIVAALACALLARRGHEKLAFCASSGAVKLTVLSVGFALFPFLMPSSVDPKSSLTVWDASSSHHTLGLMLVATAIFLPLILLYTGWVYRVMRGRVSFEHVKQSHGVH
ncbi:MAG TPA: cytochrome d ubiquinol oxidase subunit II [Casimicrobiaceae bacterium]|nr:cytochrome d ubiquinol oxidase subunit II [Casimicrobiaceae bacterium]